MNNDKLDKLLKDYDNHRGSGQFAAASKFKEKFFEAVKGAKPETKSKIKPGLWLIGTISAIAALVFFSIVPFNVVSELPVQKIKQTVAVCGRKLMRQLKSVFPEKSVGLSLINGELKTFDVNEGMPRDILICYSLQRESDGREMKLSIATSSNNFSNLDSKLANGSVWVYQPDSKLLNVDTDLALQLDPQTTIKISGSSLLKLDQKQFVSEFKYQGQKYKLFQSACRI